MNKISKLTLVLLTLSITGVLSIAAITSSNGPKEAYGYNRSSLPTTIDLKDNTRDEILSYYSSLNPSTLSASERQGSNLLKHLKTILKNDQKYFGYDSSGGDDIWKMYEITDRDWELSPASGISGYNSNTNKITGYSYGSTNPYIHALYVNRDVENQTTAWDDHQQTQWGINREHIWPKSQGFNGSGNGGARGDPMHLWAGNGRVNGTEHNNNPYGFVDTSKSYSYPNNYSNLSGNLKGTSLSKGSGTVFEPQDCDKGDIARAIFYMVARYNYLSGSDSDGIDTNNPNLELVDTPVQEASYTSTTTTTGKMGILRDLLAWNRLDPPDEFEIHRNNLLYNNYTNNRNPFIDFPEWAEYIWGSVSLANDDRTITSYSSTATGSANPSSDTINGFGGEVQPSISIDHTIISINVDDTATITATSSDSSTISWTTSNSGIASISSASSNSGSGITITGVSAGSATITASATIGGNVYSKTCSITVNSGVAPVDEKGTSENPYTVSEAWDIIDALASGKNNGQVVYVTGTVTSDEITYNANYNSCTFNITDGEKTITAYSISDASTTEGDDFYIHEGYTVVVGGALIKYNNSTYEVGYANGYPSSIILSTAPTGSVNISLTSASLLVGNNQSISATSSNNSTISWSSADTSIAQVSSNSSASGSSINIIGVAAGTTTITASATINAQSVEATCSITVRSSNVEFELFTGTLVEGNYILTYNNKAINNTLSSNRLQYETVSPQDGVITNPDSSYVWHLAPSSTNWTIYNAVSNGYISSNGNANQLQLLEENDANNSALWSVSKENDTYDFVNVRNNALDINKYLRNNGSYGFACYSSSRGGPLTLYKQAVPTVTSVTVDPTVLELDLNGTTTHTLTATVSGTHSPSQDVTWESSDNTIATVNAEGLVTALKKGDVTITATSMLDNTKSGSCSLTVVNSAPDPVADNIHTFKRITSTNDLSDGTYMIVYEIGNLALDGDLNSVDVASNYQSASISNHKFDICADYCVYIREVEDGNNIRYTIQTASGYYIGNTSDSNAMSANTSTQYLNDISFDGDNVTILSSGGAYLRFNSTSGQTRFRYYRSNSYTNQKAIQLYRMEDELYAEMFLASIECDQTGVNAPICTWSSLEDDYLALSTTSKAHFVAASKNESGSVVEKAVARYDYIINKYGTSSYKNFMNRTITPANRNIHILNYNSSIILLIFAEGVISISAVALLLRRKKKKAK